MGKRAWAAAGRLAGAVSGMVQSPVFLREVRGFMRGWRSPVSMAAYTVLLSLVTLRHLSSLLFSVTTVSGPAAPVVGRGLLFSLAGLQLVMVGIVTPAFLCNAISGERERGTLQLLGLTLLSARAVILGKYCAVLCYVGLLLLSGLPAFAMTVLLGGVSPVEIVAVYLGTALVVVLGGAVGLLASSLVRRTYAATAIAFVLMVVLAVALPACLSSGFVFVLFAATSAAGVVTAAARAVFPRVRRGHAPTRAVYIAIWGGCYCAFVAPLNVTGGEQWLTGELQRLSSGLMHWTGYGPQAYALGLLGVASPMTLALGALLAVFVCCGALSALLAAVSLFRAARAPEADSLEAEAHYYRTLQPGIEEAA